MKIYRILFFVSVLVSFIFTADAQRLTIIIKNIRDNQGKVGAAIYNNEEDFLKKYVDSQSVAAVAGEVKLVFDKLRPGEYAISILHDFNDNGEMDTDFLGIPKEGFGFSNDVIGVFGPPKFERAKIKFSGGNQTVVITMKYI